jgi:hypothetical protein
MDILSRGCVACARLCSGAQWLRREQRQRDHRCGHAFNERSCGNNAHAYGHGGRRNYPDGYVVL